VVLDMYASRHGDREWLCFAVRIAAGQALVERTVCSGLRY